MIILSIAEWLQSGHLENFSLESVSLQILKSDPVVAGQNRKQIFLLLI